MKILVIGDKKRYEKFLPDMQIVKESERIYFPPRGTDEELLKIGADAEVILVDAMSYVSAEVIWHMPNLKMIHSEGVGFEKIAIEEAAARGIYVCNNKGANAGSVAEQAVLLMLGVLRSTAAGNEAVMSGHQIEMKEERMVSGITDLADCTVGLVGFGDIAKATAERLRAFGCKCYYYSLHRKDCETEEKYNVEYKSLEELLPLCDIVSLHAAVTPDTAGMMNTETFSRMKEGAYLINTARGDLVNQEALCEALESGHIKGAGLDTIFPEPALPDNPLIVFAKEHPDRILFSPHIGGVTTGSFQRMHNRMWENVQRVAKGEKPYCVVNGL